MSVWKRLLLVVFCALPSALQAQEEEQVVQLQQFLFGYFSYEQAMKAMPEYAKVEQDMAALRKQYDNEAKRAEDEFNLKYEDFLEGQRDFAPSILNKRQAELQDILDKNVAFRKEAQRLIDQARQEALQPLRDKISVALQRLAGIRGYAFVLNTDGDALPFVDATRGEDINATLQNILQTMQ